MWERCGTHNPLVFGPWDLAIPMDLREHDTHDAVHERHATHARAPAGKGARR